MAHWNAKFRGCMSALFVLYVGQPKSLLGPLLGINLLHFRSRGWLPNFSILKYDDDLSTTFRIGHPKLTIYKRWDRGIRSLKSKDVGALDRETLYLNCIHPRHTVRSYFVHMEGGRLRCLQRNNPNFLGQTFHAGFEWLQLEFVNRKTPRSTSFSHLSLPHQISDLVVKIRCEGMHST